MYHSTKCVSAKILKILENKKMRSEILRPWMTTKAKMKQGKMDFIKILKNIFVLHRTPSKKRKKKEIQIMGQNICKYYLWEEIYIHHLFKKLSKFNN